MADFPPLPTTSLATLCEMFPNMQVMSPWLCNCMSHIITLQRSVVEMIMKEAQGDCEKAMEHLLAMSDEQSPTPKVQADQYVNKQREPRTNSLVNIAV